MPTRPPFHRPTRARIPEARPTAHQRGYGVQWRRLRAAYLLAHPLCVQCQMRGSFVPAKHVDHIVAREQGGSDDDTNLQALCHSCHSKKTVRYDHGFGHRPKEDNRGGE